MSSYNIARGFYRNVAMTLGPLVFVTFCVAMTLGPLVFVTFCVAMIEAEVQIFQAAKRRLNTDSALPLVEVVDVPFRKPEERKYGK